MNKTLQIFILVLISMSCYKDDTKTEITDNTYFISGVDISSYPEISKTGAVFYGLDKERNDFLNILKNNGVNTIRLRLWINPKNEHSAFNEVKEFAETLKHKGFKIYLTLHYSDTWADPSKQEISSKWQKLNFESVKSSVFSYTLKIMNEIQPEYIQIGNEINSGFIHPYGHITNNFVQLEELMSTAISAVRTSSKTTKIIIHFAGIEGSEWFFEKINILDYDIIGLSYYPIWHGKSLNTLQTSMKNLSEKYHKKILIAETAYPFTLEYKDKTNNIVGLEEHLILPNYKATEEGQRKFIHEIKKITTELKNGVGFCYWGAELISWKGDKSTNASPWENQALFDFNNKALPVLKEFRL